APFRGKRLRHLDDAGLRRGIGVNRARGHAGNRSNIDDGAVAALRHPHANAARHHEGAAQINVDLAVPLLHPHLFEAVHLAKMAAAVAKPVNAPVSFSITSAPATAPPSLATTNGGGPQNPPPAIGSGLISTMAPLLPCPASSLAVAAPM